MFLGRELRDDERLLLDRAVDDAEVRRRIEATGIGEYVGAADRIIDALRLAPSVSPHGNAIIRGCADWMRTGALSPAPGRLVRTLAEPHLSKKADGQGLRTGPCTRGRATRTRHAMRTST